MKCSVAMQCVLVPAVVVCLCTLAVAEETEHHFTAAFAWLEQAQDSESGFWGPDQVRDTASVLQTVQLYPGSGIDVHAARQYLRAQQPVSTDYRARKILALADDVHGVEQDVAGLLLRQNSDGGFGFADGYPSAIIDSLMALDALVLAGVDDDAVIGSALGYLTALQHSSGAFFYDRSGPASLEVTCRALIVMSRLQPRYNLLSFAGRAAGFISGHQNVDGGFGEAGSSVIETSLAILALQAEGSKAQAVSNARTFLLSVQDSVGGSWNGRVRDTALALDALHASDGIDLPNLQVHPSGIIIRPSFPAAGQRVTVTCEVRNTGSRMAENIEVELYLGDPAAGGQFLDRGTIASLEAAASADVQWTFMLTDEPGKAALYVVVDPDGLIPEISTADNVAVKHFTFGTLPDLVIASIDLSTVSPLADEPFTVSAEVQNLGESDAGPVTVGLYQGDPATTVPLLEVALNNVCGGYSGRADFELTLPAGTYEYVISVSADAGVVEEDFDNNDKTCTFTVVPALGPGLDLAVTESGIVFSSGYPREDEPIRISASIRNQGDVAARDAVVEVYAVNALPVSTLLHTFSGVDVGAGSIVNLTLDGVRLAAGTYGIYVHITAAPAQQDTAPDNNIASKTLSVLDVQDVVDLAVDDLSFSPSMPHAGDSVIVRFRITNHGNIGLAGITFGVYDGDPRNGGTLVIDSLQTLPFLEAGQSRYASGVFDTDGRGGEQTLYVFIDAVQAVGEVDEENNIASGTFTVVHDSGPDIVVNAGGLEFSPVNPSVDDELRISCTVYNQGSSNISGAFQVALYAGLPQGDMKPVAVGTIDRLDANAYVRLVFTTRAALFAASQTIFVHADNQDAIAETNEYNNTVRMPITVVSPDLSISDDDLSVESGHLLPGQPFALNAAIHNIGAIDATDVAVTVFNGPPENAQERARVSLPLVAAGSSETAVFSISLPAGSHTLHVVVDPDGFVAESDTSNNSASLAVTVGLPDEEPVLDLTASRVRLNSNNLPDSAAITVRVSNAGTVDVDPGVDVAFYSGDPAVGAILLGVEQKASALPAGAYEDVTFVWNNPAEGDYTLFIVVDDDGTGQGQLTEINEINNTAVAPVTITYSSNPKDRAVSQGAQWLVDHQHSLGGWEAFTPARANAATLQALHISGLHLDPEFSAMYTRLLERVHETQATNGSWENGLNATADSLLALIACGENISSPAVMNAVAWLKRVQQDDGGWNNSPPQAGHVVWALMAAGTGRDDPAILKARQWLLATRNPDGFWGVEAGEPSHNYVFHFALVGLHWACDASDTVGQAAITKAVTWLRAKGWSSNRSETNHNCAYLNALFYTGRNSGDISAALSSLKGLQRSNGGWLEINATSTPLEDPRVTAEALISLYRHSATGGGSDTRKACRWLKTMMTDTYGDLPYPYDQASATSAALLALNVVNDFGEYNETISEALVRIIRTQKSNGNWHPQFSMNHSQHKHLHAGASVLRALGETELNVSGKSKAITKAANYLITYQDDDGGWPYYSYPAGEPSEIFPTILSLLGLLSKNVIITVEQRVDIQGGIEWLLQQSADAGAWSGLTDAANSAKILNRFGGYQSEIDDAVNYLKQAQNADGGWGTYESGVANTAVILLALIQTGNQGPETAKAVQWLLAVQNNDGGWPILPGIPNSSTAPTSHAVRALSLADYTPGPELAISFDKSAYQPGETVTISVAPKDNAYHVQQVSGAITEYEGATHSISFAKIGRVFIGTHVLSAGHIAGTDIVSVEAQSLEGITGYSSGTFVVENKSVVPADLSIAGSDIMFSPDMPDEGRMVQIAAQVRNIGQAASGETVVRFLNGTQPIGAVQALASLAPGASDVVFMQWDTHGQLGRNYIHVVVDPDQLVADADPVNNRVMRPIDVAALSLPDLEVRDSDVSFVHTSPIEGAHAEISATVRNLGADIDGVVVHFYEGEAVPANLIAERIIRQVLLSRGSIPVHAPYDTAGKAGQRRIIVKADPGNVIREQNEANNSGAALLDVIPGGLALELSLDRESYEHADDVLITARINNSFAVERTVQLDVAIRDGNNTVIAEPAQALVIVLPPGGTEVIDDRVWNTGSAMSGEWSATATLFEDGQRRAGAAAGFTIIADKGITAVISSDRRVYYDHEQVVVSSLVRSYSPNYAFTDLSAVVAIMSPDGQVLYRNVHDIAQLHPLASISWEQHWNTALNSPGLYVLNLDLMQDESLIASDADYITIANSASGGRGLSAFLNVEPDQVHRGQDVALTYGLTNSGNAALDELPLVFRAVHLTTQQETTVLEGICILEGGTCSATGMLDSSGLACGDYVIIVSALIDGTAHNLAFAPLSIVNRCPVAVANQDVMAHVGDLAQLNGSDSYDFDGDSLSYSWVLASAPAGSNAELVGSGLYNPVLPVDRHGTYELRLSVSDGICQSQPDSVLVSTENRPPVAVAGESMLVDVNETVQLDGTASHDPDNDPIEHYEWTMVVRPAGSMAVLSDRFIPDPVFAADVAGEYRLQLVVRDFEYASDPFELVVTTINRRPVADSGPDCEAGVGDAVHLDGSASYDPDADFLSYRWAILSAPQGSMAVISDSTAPAPVFNADTAGAYIIQLIVNDGDLDSIPDTSTIITRSLPPECADDLGVAQQYSVFALNTVASNHAVVGGRIATGGDADLHNVVIGSHVPHGAPAEPVLVSGGNIIYSSGVVHRGSIIASGSVDGVADKVRRTMARGSTVVGNSNLPFEFTQESLRLRQLSTRLGGLSPTGTAESFAVILTLRGDGTSPIQIFNITSQQARRARSLHLRDIPCNATVIINISGQQAEVSHIIMAIPGWLRGRVLFNFFEARTLEFTAVAVTGSVLAPFAELTNSSGIIFGTVIVDSWQGSMNVGHEPFVGVLPKCEP